jgi:hypothetical protein
MTRVWDEDRVVDGRRARVFGFEYETLPGHLEIGRMDCEVLRFLADGAVRFRFACPLARVGRRRCWARIGFLLSAGASGCGSMSGAVPGSLG